MAAKKAKGRAAGSGSSRVTIKPTLRLVVQYMVDRSSLPTRHQFRRWVQAALEHDAEITLRIVDDLEGQQLNRDYRKKDYATNVLTFEFGEPFPGQPLMGDIVLCAPVVAREADERGQAIDIRYAHLTVHGVLHMQGYDHEKIRDAKIMEAREVEILAGFGIADPYEEN